MDFSPQKSSSTPLASTALATSPTSLTPPSQQPELQSQLCQLIRDRITHKPGLDAETNQAMFQALWDRGVRPPEEFGHDVARYAVGNLLNGRAGSQDNFKFLAQHGMRLHPSVVPIMFKTALLDLLCDRPAAKLALQTLFDVGNRPNAELTETVMSRLTKDSLAGRQDAIKALPFLSQLGMRSVAASSAVAKRAAQHSSELGSAAMAAERVKSMLGTAYATSPAKPLRSRPSAP